MQYETIVNMSSQEIERLKSYIILQESILSEYSNNDFEIKRYLRYLKRIKECGFRYYDDYKRDEILRYEKFEEDLEEICCKDYFDDPIIKQNIKKTKRKIHQEKFKMCIHKLKLSLPDHLIYELGAYF